MPETHPPIALAGRSIAEIEADIRARRRPPVERWDPAHCGDSAMRIDREGRWWHEGRPITRPALVRQFASVLRREADGRHVLVTPGEKLDIAVELAALRIVAMTREGEGDTQRIAFGLDDGDAVILSPSNPLSLRDAVPVVRARHGLEASLARPVYLELAELALTSDPPGVWSDGSFFALEER